MTKVRALAAVAVWTAALTSGTAGTAPLPQSPAHAHIAMTPAELKWGAASPALPAGATSAVIYGDPSKEGQPFVFRVKLPDGYRIAPHWHPTDEHVTVLQGTFLMGMGEKFEKGALKSLGVGAYAHTTAKTPHFALTKGETIVQVHGVGPFTLTYANPEDDPRKKTSAR
jgi:quercetin dioxygenase-like cupin family protein